MVKNPSANADVRGAVRSLGREDPPEEGVAAHCSLPGWRIPRTQEPGGLQSMGSAKGRTLSHRQAGSCFLLSVSKGGAAAKIRV